MRINLRLIHIRFSVLFEIQIEEANLESETTMEVTLENYFKVLAKRIIGEMYWLIFGSISVCAIAFLFFNGELP